MARCNRSKSKPCGKGCISLTKTCRKSGKSKSTCAIKKKAKSSTSKKIRKTPKCTAGVTKRCGKACVSIRKDCNVPGFKSKGRKCADAARKQKQQAIRNAQIRQMKHEDKLAKEFLRENASAKRTKCNQKGVL